MPFRHVAALDELSDEEYLDFIAVLREAITALNAAYEPDGMNVGHEPRLGGRRGHSRSTCTRTRCRAGTATPIS